MPKAYGMKEKDKAADYIVDRLLSGDLRTGDRVDRNELAAALGMSRIPVQEAIVQLERDGLLTSKYHRGVYVERFDADVLREHYEVYGELNGLVTSQAAENPSPELLAELQELLEQMRDEPDLSEIEELGWRFRRAINHKYAGPRMRAAIRSSQTFIPKLFWIGEADNSAIMVESYADEIRAIEQGDTEGARLICVARSGLMATVAIRELEDRGVFDPADNEFNDYPERALPSPAVAAAG